MATNFLNIAGLRIPVDSCSETVAQAYGDTRAFNGTARKGRVAIKRQWAIKSTPMYIEDAIAIAGLLGNRHDQWDFDDATLFSDKGVNSGYNFTVSTVPAFVPNNSSADGKFNPESPPFSPYAIYTRPPATNLITPTTDSTFEGASPPSSLVLTTGGGGSVALTGTRFYQGVSSLKFTFAAAPQGFRVGPYTVSTNTNYTVSMMLYNGSAGAVTLALTAANATSAPPQTATTTITLPAGGWYRAAVTVNSGGNTSLYYTLADTTGQGTANSVCIDAVQLEVGGASSPYTVPGTTGIGQATANPLWLAPCSTTPTFDAFTEAPSGEVAVGIWAQFASFDAQRFLFELFGAGGTNPTMGLYTNTGNSLVAYAYNEAGTLAATCAATLATGGRTDDWHHILVNFRTVPHRGGNSIDVYVDGALVTSKPASTAPASTPMPRLSSVAQLKIRVGADANGWTGMYNQVQFFQFAVPASIVAQLYAQQPQLSAYSSYVMPCSGSIMGAGTVLVMPRSISVVPMVAHGPGGLIPYALQAMGTVSFSLEEQ